MQTTVSLGFFVPDLIDCKLNSELLQFHRCTNDSGETTSPLPVVNLASKPEVCCVTSCKMPLLRRAELVVIPGHCQGLGSTPALISGLLDADLQHTDTDTLLPQEGCAGVPGLSSGTGPKMSFFGTKIGDWRVYGAAHLICSGFFGACTQSGWTDPWAGPCSLHSPYFGRTSQIPLFRPKASISEIGLNH